MDELETRLADPQVLERIIEEVIQAFLVPRFDDYGMDATGEWKANIRAEGNKVIGRSYTEQLEYGRRPGTPPPIAPLIRWVEAKLGLAGKEGIGVAYAIRNKIAKEGTTWYKQGGTQLLEALQEPAAIEYFRREYGFFIVQETKLYYSQVLLQQLKKQNQ